MSKRWILLVLFGLGLVAGIAVAGNDAKISLDQVPAKAREALLKLANGNPITEVEREKEHGKVFYEAEWLVDGRETEAKVTADGDLVELEEVVDAKDVPAAVKAVVAKKFPAGAKIEYEKVMIVVYEVEAMINGKEREIMVLPTGKIMGKKKGHHGRHDDGEDEENISIDQVPDAVKATILAEAKGAQIKEIERESKKGKTVYEAEWVVDGQEIEIKVAPDGTLLKREVEQEDDDDDDDDNDDDDDDDD